MVFSHESFCMDDPCKKCFFYFMWKLKWIHKKCLLNMTSYLFYFIYKFIPFAMDFILCSSLLIWSWHHRISCLKLITNSKISVVWLRSLPNTTSVRNTTFGGTEETLSKVMAWQLMIKRWNKNQTAKRGLLVLKFSTLALFVITEPLAPQGRLLVMGMDRNFCYQNPSW